VRVFTVDPGEMDTRMHADAIPDADRAQLGDPARVADRILALVRGEGTPPGARIAVGAGPAAAVASPAPPPTTTPGAR
jgi:hypothetical protein